MKLHPFYHKEEHYLIWDQLVPNKNMVLKNTVKNKSYHTGMSAA